MKKIVYIALILILIQSVNGQNFLTYTEKFDNWITIDKDDAPIIFANSSQNDGTFIKSTAIGDWYIGKPTNVQSANFNMTAGIFWNTNDYVPSQMRFNRREGGTNSGNFVMELYLDDFVQIRNDTSGAQDENLMSWVNFWYNFTAGTTNAFNWKVGFIALNDTCYNTHSAGGTSFNSYCSKGIKNCAPAGHNGNEFTSPFEDLDFVGTECAGYTNVSFYKIAVMFYVASAELKSGFIHNLTFNNMLNVSNSLPEFDVTFNTSTFCIDNEAGESSTEVEFNITYSDADNDTVTFGTALTNTLNQNIFFDEDFLIDRTNCELDYSYLQSGEVYTNDTIARSELESFGQEFFAFGYYPEAYDGQDYTDAIFKTPINAIFFLFRQETFTPDVKCTGRITWIDSSQPIYFGLPDTVNRGVSSFLGFDIIDGDNDNAWNVSYLDSSFRELFTYEFYYNSTTNNITIEYNNVEIYNVVSLVQFEGFLNDEKYIWIENIINTSNINNINVTTNFFDDVLHQFNITDFKNFKYFKITPVDVPLNVRMGLSRIAGRGSKFQITPTFSTEVPNNFTATRVDNWVFHLFVSDTENQPINYLNQSFIIPVTSCENFVPPEDVLPANVIDSMKVFRSSWEGYCSTFNSAVNLDGGTGLGNFGSIFSLCNFLPILYAGLMFIFASVVWLIFRNWESLVITYTALLSIGSLMFVYSTTVKSLIAIFGALAIISLIRKAVTGQSTPTMGNNGGIE